MTTDQLTENAAALFRGLIELLIDYPQNLVITPHAICDVHGKHWRTDWEVCPDVNDAGKIIGKAGAHVKALKRIVEMVGEADRLRYVLRVVEGTGERRPEIVRKLAGPDYSSDKHGQILAEVLAAAGIDAQVVGTLEHKTPMTFGLEIQPTNRLARENLTEEPFSTRAPSLLNALAVLFKAAGHRDGAVYRVEVK